MKRKDDPDDGFEQLPSRASSVRSAGTRGPSTRRPSAAIDDPALDRDQLGLHDGQADGSSGEDKEGGDKQKWWEMSLVLKNTGSVARDHLASERTFLAWMRTSVSLAMAGVGQFLSDGDELFFMG